MDGQTKQFCCIDLKSYYASVECVDRGLDPLTTNPVVADESRSDGTICLAVSPSLKALGVPGRPRLFEVKQKLQEIENRTGKKVAYPDIHAPCHTCNKDIAFFDPKTDPFHHLFHRDY